MNESPVRPSENALTAEPTPRSRPLHRFFVGDHGLRPGWRVAIYFVVFGLLAFAIGQAANHLFPRGKSGNPRLSTQLAIQVAVTIAAFLPALVFSRIEKRPFGAYGLPRKGAFAADFWIGGVWGLAWLSILLLAIGACGDFSLGGLAQHGAQMLKYGAFWAVFFLAVGLFEEFLFRGYSLFTLTNGMGFWPGALLLSTIFGAVHLGNQGEAAIGALAAGLIGLFFCFTVRRTGNLWFAVGFHASWDWGESFLYSTPDSGQMARGHLLNSSFHGSKWITGGTVGPEGSLWVLLVILALWIAFQHTHPRVVYPVQEG